MARELVSMDVTIGERGLDKTWQKSFPVDTECCRCGGPSRIAFVAHEGIDESVGEDEEAVWKIHLNKGGDGGAYWPHDRVAVAVYFCEDCLEPTALYNQA